MLRRTLLALSGSRGMRSMIIKAPLTRDVVRRFVAGETDDHALAAAHELIRAGLRVSIDHLGEDTVDRAQAERITIAYVDLLARLHDTGLATATEVSIKLSALGQALGPDGNKIALENAEVVCGAARNAGTTVTLDMEDHTTTDDTLAVVHELRLDFPETGAVLQAYLHRTEADCRELSGAGSRVRLCKGAYDEPASVAFSDPHEVAKSYVRCLKILLAGKGYPMVATHDPRLIEIARKLARDHHRDTSSYEFQMLYGIRPGEQQRLAGLGHQVRVYLPYGTDWYAYFLRRLAERPANLTFFAHSLFRAN